MPRPQAFAAFLLITPLLLVGCGRSLTNVGLFPQTADPEVAQTLSKLPYPQEAELGEDLDVLIVKDGNVVEIANREANSFEKIELWLNRRYVTRVERVEIGVNRPLRLVDFINEHGEAYPTTGLLSPDVGQRLVLAEIYDPAARKRHRLLVRLKEPRD